MKNHECSLNIIHAHVCECWIEEFRQLKRMQDNIKRKLDKLKNDEASYAEIEPDEYDEVRQRMKYEIELLESLDK